MTRPGACAIYGLSVADCFTVSEREVAIESPRKPLSVILGLVAFAVLFHFGLCSFYSRSSRTPLAANSTASVVSIRIHTSATSLRGSANSTPNQLYRSTRRSTAE